MLLNFSLIHFSENIQKFSKMFLDRPISPSNMAVYWVEYIAKYGNVLQSPALNLYWWQRYLLDVYAVIFAVIITVLYTVLFIFRKLKKFLCGSRTSTKKDNAAMKSKKNKWKCCINNIPFCFKSKFILKIIFSFLSTKKEFQNNLLRLTSSFNALYNVLIKYIFNYLSIWYIFLYVYKYTYINIRI